MVGVVNTNGRGLQIFARASRADREAPPLLNPGYATASCLTSTMIDAAARAGYVLYRALVIIRTATALRVLHKQLCPHTTF